MILECKYIGPFSAVLVPGFRDKLCKRGATVKIRIRDGFPVGGCWEIVGDDKDYLAALEKQVKETAKLLKARQKRAKETLRLVEKTLDAASGAETSTKPKLDSKAGKK